MHAHPPCGPQVSDFGLSRVEDDETHASFPFNSCGTAAYVAPEALICNKKVNSSVDVYAFGILMWEVSVWNAHVAGERMESPCGG